MESSTDRNSARGRIVGTMLTLMGGSLFLGLLFLICGGMAYYMIAVVAGVAAFGYLHYVVWGHSFSDEVAVEREETEREEAAEQEAREQWPPSDWTPDERSWYRRF